MKVWIVVTQADDSALGPYLTVFATKEKADEHMRALDIDPETGTHDDGFMWSEVEEHDVVG